MKLKTLKDMNICPDCTLEGDHIHLKELKQEAIKWIKKLNKDVDNRRFDIPPTDDYVCGRRDVLIEFFNITEEDLK